MTINSGDKAPDFTLPDQDGKAWSLNDQLGRPVVLYFYPKDNTSGCTTQACAIRDVWGDLEALDVVVAGISPDSSESHASFADKFSLPHTLLADTERAVIELYGATKTKPDGSTGVRRSSVVIGPDGVVAASFPDIAPHEQAEKSLEALRALR
jgi:thioredoxin-dependent peroxiredoxin